MKAYTKQAIGTFIKMATCELNGYSFSSWRTPDNKHFYLAPVAANLNVLSFGCNPEKYEVTYNVLGYLGMIK